MAITNINEQKTNQLEKEVKNEEQFIPISLSDLMNKQFPEATWVVDKLIPAEIGRAHV